MATLIANSVLNGSTASTTGFTFNTTALKLLVKSGKVKLQELIDGNWYDVGVVFNFTPNAECFSAPVMVYPGGVIYLAPQDLSAVLRLAPVGGAAVAEVWSV